MGKIPKIIHRAWFQKEGGKIPSKVEHCYNSYLKYAPDYEIRTWSEKNFDINISNFTKQTYVTCRYGVLTDYIRLWSLYNYGGIYLDADVEILKPIDSLLDNKLFFGWEHEGYKPRFLGTAIIGAEPHNEIIKELLDFYDKKYNFIKENGELNILQSNSLWPDIIKDKYQSFGHQFELNNLNIYPQNLLYPHGDKEITENSLTIHRYMSSWVKFYSLIIPVVEDNPEKLLNCLKSIEKIKMDKQYWTAVIVNDENYKNVQSIIKEYEKKEPFVIFNPKSNSMVEKVKEGVKHSGAYHKILCPSTHIVTPEIMDDYSFSVHCTKYDLSKYDINDFDGIFKEKYYCNNKIVISSQN